MELARWIRAFVAFVPFFIALSISRVVHGVIWTYHYSTSAFRAGWDSGKIGEKVNGDG